MKIEIGRTLNNAVNLHKQHGASLLEGIAYLGIAALVVLGAVSLLTNASASAQANQTKEELVALRTAVKKLYAGQPYPVAAMTDTLYKTKAFPSTLQPNGGAPKNTWGGTVTVEGTSTTKFMITYTGMPQEVCINVLTGSTGWDSVRQGSNGVPKSTFPLTSDDATAICTGTSNDVSFVSL